MKAPERDRARVLPARGEHGDDLGVGMAREDRAQLRPRVARGPHDRGARHPRARRERPGRRPEASRRAEPLRDGVRGRREEDRVVAGNRAHGAFEGGLVERARDRMGGGRRRFEDDEVPRRGDAEHPLAERALEPLFAARALTSPSGADAAARARRNRRPTSRARGP